MPFRILRWIFALGCLGLGTWLLSETLGSPEPESFPEDDGFPVSPVFGIAGRLIGGVLLILLGIVSLAPELVAIILVPFHALVDAVYLPGGRASRPELNLKLPAYYLQQDRPDDALAEYRKILRHHPDTLEAWVGAIDLLAGTFDEPAAARRLYRKGLRRFRRRPEIRAALESHWQRVAHLHGIR
jgi:hypothetical protein